MEEHTFHSERANVTRLPPEVLLELIQTSLDVSGRFVLTVTGNSMAPTLHHLRDQVELYAPQDRPPQPGDIVLFRRSGGRCILHRIVRRESDGFRINGDAQGWTEHIRADQVIAVAGRICRNGRWIRCDTPLYRLYGFVWRLLLPYRALMSRLRSRRRNT